MATNTPAHEQQDSHSNGTQAHSTNTHRNTHKQSSTYFLSLAAVPDLAHPVTLEVCHNLVAWHLFRLLPRLGLFVASSVSENDTVEEETGPSDPGLWNV
jgi:hypothetical protein